MKDKVAAKKVLMVLENNFPPDIRVEKEALALKNDGFEVHIACAALHVEKSVEDWNGITVFRKRMSSFILKTHVGALTFPFYFTFWRRYLKERFAENRYDIIHIHDLPLARVGLKFKHKYGIPMVLDLHENTPSYYEHARHTNTFLGKLLCSIPQWRAYEKDMVTRADRVVVVVKEMGERIQKLGADARRITEVQNTIDPAELPPPRELPAGKQKLFLYAGGLFKDRCVDVVIRGLGLLIKKEPDARMSVIGDGSMKPELEALTRDLGLEKYITFEGKKSQKEVYEQIPQAQVCLMPIMKYEQTDCCSANKVFHYMAYGRPILSAHTDSLTRVIQETGTGLTYAFDSAQDWADQAERLLQMDPAPWRKNGPEAVHGKYNWSHDRERFLEMYRNL